jgi:hypothetical protein
MTRPRERRLLIAASSLADAESALEMAQPILEWAVATPAGLLVQTDYAEFATGSAHGIVTAGGSVQRLPPAELVHRMARRDAREIERRLAELTAGAEHGAACELAFGDLVSNACAALADEDILLLGHRPARRRGGDVLLLGGPAQPDAPSRLLAELLARASSSSVAEIALDRARDEAVFQRQLGQSRVSMIVVDVGAGFPIDAPVLRRLFAAARNPIAVIGASRIGAPRPTEKGS